MRSFIITVLIIFISIPIFGQTSLKLSSWQKKRITKNWAKWTPSVEIIAKDSNQLKGQIIYPVDSGVIWRSVPQYLPYTDSSVHFIPARNIQSFEIEQPGRFGRNVLMNGLAGGFLFTSLIITNYDGFTNESGYGAFDFEGMVFGAGAVGGIVAGLLKTSIDRKHYHIETNGKNRFSLSQMLKLCLGSLHDHQGFRANNKNWPEEDSLLTSYRLPKEDLKLKKQYDGLKLEVSFAIGQANIWRKNQRNTALKVPVTIIGAEKRYAQGAYSRGKPNFMEIRVFYRINPYMKMGLQMMNTEYTRDYLGASNDYMDGMGNVRLTHAPAFGAVVELTPFPIKYLRLRRWEVNIGAGIFRESATFSHAISGENPEGSPEEYFSVSHEDKFVLPAFLSYWSITYRALPFLSFQSRFGSYKAKKTMSKGLSIDFIDPYPDVQFTPQEIDLSREYYSFGVILNI